MQNQREIGVPHSTVAKLSPEEIALTSCLSPFAINFFIQNSLMHTNGPSSAWLTLSLHRHGEVLPSLR